jgi:glycosyltransferase involved in cell wall biosynthesis
VPLAVIEYLACGKPVIATTIGSIPEMVVWEGREAAILLAHDPGQVHTTEALRHAMLRYMTVPELLEEHQQNAPIVFNARFNVERLAAEYLAFFEVQPFPLYATDVGIPVHARAVDHLADDGPIDPGPRACG